MFSLGLFVDGLFALDLFFRGLAIASPDTTIVLLPATGHALRLEPNAARVMTLVRPASRLDLHPSAP